MKPVTPNFYFISKTSKSLSVRSISFKEIYEVENFRMNVLKPPKDWKILYLPAPMYYSLYTNLNVNHFSWLGSFWIFFNIIDMNISSFNLLV